VECTEDCLLPVLQVEFDVVDDVRSKQRVAANFGLLNFNPEGRE
jgi:hypothetical protein